MSHKAKIIQGVKIIKPTWKQTYMKRTVTDRGDILKYGEVTKNEDVEFYYNVIITNTMEKYYEKVFEGEVNHFHLRKGDKIGAGDAKYIIQDVTKDIDGSVTYIVNSRLRKADDYEELLAQCVEKFNYQTLTDLIIDDGVKKVNEKKPLWKRLFSR